MGYPFTVTDEATGAVIRTGEASDLREEPVGPMVGIAAGHGALVRKGAGSSVHIRVPKDEARLLEAACSGKSVMVWVAGPERQVELGGCRVSRTPDDTRPDDEVHFFG